MAEQFTLETSTDETIKVRHLTHDHHYFFAVRNNEGRRLLGSGPTIGNTKASVPAVTLRDQARAFAEAEARKAELID
jgi:hypothetical protein